MRCNRCREDDAVVLYEWINTVYLLCDSCSISADRMSRNVFVADVISWYVPTNSDIEYFNNNVINNIESAHPVQTRPALDQDQLVDMDKRMIDLKNKKKKPRGVRDDEERNRVSTPQDSSNPNPFTDYPDEEAL